MNDLKDLVRPNVWDMKPYSSARDEYHGTASVFLDANENPYNEPYNRYPDPMQWALKDRIAELRGVDSNSIFLGNGSDEAIDLVIRAFCDPAIDSVTTISPSYGMYEVAADVSGVECRKVLLDSDFSLNADKVLAQVDEWTKVVFLCSPNNPTGNSLDRNEIYKILNSFGGIVVVDEAYIDFSSQPSFLTELDKFPNLVVLQTLSKAWGAAGIRLGMAFASPEIIEILSKIKYPYNINQLTQEYALQLLNDEGKMREQLQLVMAERERLEISLQSVPCVRTLYPTDANFILANVGIYALKIYGVLVKQGIIVRNRNKVALCSGCLRITVGTPEENDRLIEVMKTIRL